MRNPYNPEAMAAAIRAKCLDCSGGSRKLVHNCDIEYCPLWPFRRSEAKEHNQIRGQIGLFDITEKEGA